jgi:hypothetical protein
VETVDPRLVVHDEAGEPRALNYNDFIPVIVRALQEITTRLEILEAQLAAAGESVSTSLARFTRLVTDALTVGSAQAPAGITLFDEVTGTPYCLSIRNGEAVTRQGECGTQASAPPDDDDDQIVNEPPQDEPAVEPPPPDDTTVDLPPIEETTIDEPVQDETAAPAAPPDEELAPASDQEAPAA